MKKHRRHVLVDPDKWARLCLLAEKLCVSAGELVREGIDRTVELAEMQQDTVDEVLAAQASRSELWNKESTHANFERDEDHGEERRSAGDASQES